MVNELQCRLPQTKITLFAKLGNTMKDIFFALTIVLLLSACASQPASPYRAAKGSGYGYVEKPLGENRYRIEFKIGNHNRKKAEDYARLRAAELTSTQGYDWFEIKKSYGHDEATARDNTFDASTPLSRERVSRQCGLLGCRTRVQTPPNVEQDEATSFPEAIAVLEIQLGKGVRPAKNNVYDAIETSEELRTKLSL